jgi:hypothetical protein
MPITEVMHAADTPPLGGGSDDAGISRSATAPRYTRTGICTIWTLGNNANVKRHPHRAIGVAQFVELLHHGGRAAAQNNGGPTVISDALIVEGPGLYGG